MATAKKYDWRRLRDAFSLVNEGGLYGTLDRQQKREAVLYAYGLLGNVHGNTEEAVMA